MKYHDPYIATVREDNDHGSAGATAAPPRLRHSVDSNAAALSAADIVVIVTDHRSVDYQMVVDNAALVVDMLELHGLDDAQSCPCHLAVEVTPPAGRLTPKPSIRPM